MLDIINELVYQKPKTPPKSKAPKVDEERSIRRRGAHPIVAGKPKTNHVTFRK
jgi:hypothetical protein